MSINCTQLKLYSDEVIGDMSRVLKDVVEDWVVAKKIQVGKGEVRGNCIAAPRSKTGRGRPGPTGNAAIQSPLGRIV